MNGRERYFGMLRGERVDFVPRVPILMGFAADCIGSDYAAFASDYRVLTEANRRCAQDFGMDQLCSISDRAAACPTDVRDAGGGDKRGRSHGRPQAGVEGVRRSKALRIHHVLSGSESEADGGRRPHDSAGERGGQDHARLPVLPGLPSREVSQPRRAVRQKALGVHSAFVNARPRTGPRPASPEAIILRADDVGAAVHRLLGRRAIVASV